MGLELAETRKKKRLSIDDAYAFMVEEIAAGSDKDYIIRALTDLGMDGHKAKTLVGCVEDEMKKSLKAQKTTPMSMPPAFIAGLFSSAAAAAAAAYLGFGFLLFSAGFFSGKAAVWGSGGKKGKVMQATSAVCFLSGVYVASQLPWQVDFSAWHSILGILVGFYLSWTIPRASGVKLK